MRKLVVFCLLYFTIVPFTAGQVWCPPGAQWRYRFHTNFPDFQPEGILQVQFEKDSIFQGRDCQYLISSLLLWNNQGTLTTFPGTNYFTSLDNDMILFWNDWAAAFDTLIAFSLPIGSEWQYQFFDTSTVTLLDTGQKNVDGELLRYSVVSTAPSFNTGPQDTIYERIGALQLFSPWPLLSYFVDGSNGSLMCYKDDTFDFILDSGSITECSNSLLVQSMSKNQNWDVSAFPVVNDGYFDLKYPNELGIGELMIIDQFGRSIGFHAVKSSAGNIEVNISSCASGIYRCIMFWPSIRKIVTIVVINK